MRATAAQDEPAVDVLTLASDAPRQGYRCVECQSRMVARLGRVKVWHFAHMAGYDRDCSGETYLHIMAKNLFLLAFRRCRRDGEPFFYERVYDELCGKSDKPRVCGETRRYHDLAALYDEIHMEKRDGTLAPDLLLRKMGTEGRCYVEIHVSHRVSARKHDVGVPIIELRVQSEEDLDRIAAASLSAEMVTEHNMKRTPVWIASEACPRPGCPSIPSRPLTAGRSVWEFGGGGWCSGARAVWHPGRQPWPADRAMPGVSSVLWISGDREARIICEVGQGAYWLISRSGPLLGPRNDIRDIIEKVEDFFGCVFELL